MLGWAIGYYLPLHDVLLAVKRIPFPSDSRLDKDRYIGNRFFLSTYRVWPKLTIFVSRPRSIILSKGSLTSVLALYAITES